MQLFVKLFPFNSPKLEAYRNKPLVLFPSKVLVNCISVSGGIKGLVNLSSLYYAPRKISRGHIVAALSVRPSVRPIRVRPITSLLEVGFWNYFTEMTTMLRRSAARNYLGPYLEGRGHSKT